MIATAVVSQFGQAAAHLARTAKLDAVEARAVLFIVEQHDPEGEEAAAWRIAAHRFDEAATALRKVVSRGQG